MCEQTTEALLEEKLDDKIEKVEGATGYPAMIVGTKHALAKIENQGTVVLSDTEERKRTGLIGMYKHCSLVELAREYILILPVAGEGLVKLGYEGNLTVKEGKTEDRKDRQMEVIAERDIHLGVAVAKVFGALKIQG